MEITTTARHCEITPAIRAHCEDKVGRLQRYFDGLREASVIISKEKFRYTTEITLAIPGAPDLVSREETTDMHASIDGAVDRLEAQVKKHKGRLRDRREKGDPLAEALQAREPVAEAEPDLD